MFKSFYDNVPRVIKLFLLRAALIFAGWQLLYQFVLAPARIPDRFLCNITALSSSELLSVFYRDVQPLLAPPNSTSPSSVMVDGARSLSILDSCNALDVYVLYIAFLFCFPGKLQRRVLFILIGLPIILLANTIRCAAIAWLNLTHKTLVDVSHHYVFTGVVYLLVFYLWFLYSKKR